MSVIARSAARSVRALHTTVRLLNDAPASSSSGASSSGSALGFGDYSGRTRKLPTLKISATSRQNVLKPRRRGDDANGDSAQAKGESGDGGRRGARPPQQDRRKRQGRSPLQAQQAKIRETDAAAASPAVNGGEDEFFDPVTVAATARSRPAGLKKVDIDFNPVNVKLPSAGGGAKGRRNANNSTAAEKRSSRTREARPRAPPVVEVEDRSPEGIFGRASLLFPLRRGARDAESSVWAEGLKPEQARKMELARLAGSPAVYLPNKPIPTELTGKNAAQASKMLSSWLLASNPGVSMRRAKTGEAIIKGYL